MPQPTEKHRHQEVDIGAYRSLSISPQRYVEIVSKPGGEGDVPATPELRDIPRLVRRIKVDVEPEA